MRLEIELADNVADDAAIESLMRLEIELSDEAAAPTVMSLEIELEAAPRSRA